MPTLADVGKAAKVSRGTVSNVFNRPELVRPEVRERVWAAARKLGYGGPDPKGRLLKDGRFNAIGYLPPGDYSIAEVLRSPYGRELLIGVSQACDAAGAALSLISGDAERRARGIAEALVDGFVLGQSVDIDQIRSVEHRRLPFVILDDDGGAEFNSIRIDARNGAIAAARHLTALGHRRIVVLSARRTAGPPIAHPNGAAQLQAGFALDVERLEGFKQGLAEAGLDARAVPIIETTPGDQSAGATLLDRFPEATAVLAMSDWQAMTVLDEAARRGMGVPSDISVVGFDGTSDAARTTPPLTTVAHDVAGKGRLAASMILESGPPRQVIMPVELVVRGSTGAPRTSAA